MSEGRTKRRSALRKAALPSAAHYVGYVEEDETPEMIMKKFEELEKIMANNKDRPQTQAAGEPSIAGSPNSSSGPGLNDAQLTEVFKATSIYSVKAIMSNNEALMLKQHNKDPDLCSYSDGAAMTDSEEDVLDELKGFWSDEDWGSLKRQHRRHKGKKRDVAAQQEQQQQRSRPPRLPGGASGPRIAYVTHFNPDTQAFIRRRVRLPDKDAIAQLRVPGPPLPASWGRAVQPLAPSCGAAAGSAVFTTADITSFQFSALPQQQYLAVLINRGWLTPPQPGSHIQQQQPSAGAAGRSSSSSRGRPRTSKAAAAGGSSSSHAVLDPVAQAVQEQLGVLPLHQLCPRGFIFIWLRKEDISPVVRCMADAGYSYVENLTWVLMAPNHSVLRLPAAYSRQSHLSLYIFRREGEGRDIELRHQRNPDVVFDCVCTPDGCNWRTPQEVLTIIETLLPTGMGSFLELWAPQGVSREGWTHLVQTTANTVQQRAAAACQV